MVRPDDQIVIGTLLLFRGYVRKQMFANLGRQLAGSDPDRPASLAMELQFHLRIARKIQRAVGRVVPLAFDITRIPRLAVLVAIRNMHEIAVAGRVLGSGHPPAPDGWVAL